MLLKTMMVKLVLVYFLLIGSVSASTICREAQGKYGADWKSPILPEKSSDQSSRLAEYCKTNPHAFDKPFSGLRRPVNPLQCYTYKNNGLVLELPNGLFCEDKTNNYLDSLVSRYTISLAAYYMSGFELIIYNEKHRVYQRFGIGEDHIIFKNIRFNLAFAKRANFVYKKISSGEYSQLIANCAFMEKTVEGEDCPSEITEMGPILPAGFSSLNEYYSDQIPAIKHEALK